jgi:SAM-dependent methyltransferase
MHSSDEPTLDYDPRSLEALSGLARYHAWIRGDFGDVLRGRVAEVGAGTGNFSETWVDGADEATLIEPAPQLHTLLAKRFAGRAHVKVVGATLEEALATGSLARESLDALTMVNVLERVEDDLGELRRVREALRPGGAVALFVPAIQAIYGSLDALVGHHRRYEREGLGRVVRDAGFEVETLRWFDVAGVVPWWLVGRVLRARSFDGPLGPLYDRLVVPVMSRVERAVPPPLGKNLLCVARVPRSRAAHT